MRPLGLQALLTAGSSTRCARCGPSGAALTPLTRRELPVISKRSSFLPPGRDQSPATAGVGPSACSNLPFPGGADDASSQRRHSTPRPTCRRPPRALIVCISWLRAEAVDQRPTVRLPVRPPRQSDRLAGRLPLNHDRFFQAVAFAEQHSLPIVQFEHGQRKDEGSCKLSVALSAAEGRGVHRRGAGDPVLVQSNQAHGLAKRPCTRRSHANRSRSTSTTSNVRRIKVRN